MDLPRHIQDALIAVTQKSRATFLAAIDARRPDPTASQEAKTERLLRKAGLL